MPPTDIANIPGPVVFSGAGVLVTQAAKAQSLIGAGAQGIAALFHATAMLYENGHTYQVSLSGSQTPVAGLWRLATGVTANTVVQGGLGHSATAFAAGFRTGQNWYASGRFAVGTAITAQTRAHIGLCDSTGTPSLSVGVIGATSTGFFTVVGTAGAAITSTVAVDTALHTHVAYRVGSVTTYEIDGVVVGSGTADIAAASGPLFQITNGTDAVNRSMDLIWYGGAAQFL